MNPKVTLYDEDEEGNLKPYSPKPTATQEYLWRLYEHTIQEIKDFSKGTEILLLFLGDPVHGNHFMNELVSTRQSDQLSIALSNFDPLYELKNLTAVRFAIGTESHEFGEGSSTQVIVEALSREYKEVSTRAVNHGLFTITGHNVSIDFSHHGPGASQRVWLEGNTALYYLRDRMMKEMLKGNKPADLYLRGHIHVPVNVITNVREHESRLIVCPSMCVMSGFARKATKSGHSVANGMVLFKVSNGQLSKPKFVIEELDLRTKENYEYRR